MANNYSDQLESEVPSSDIWNYAEARIIWILKKIGQQNKYLP